MNFKYLLLLFLLILVPILEIYLLIVVGNILGVFPTVLLLFLTAILGTYLLKTQGLALFLKIQGILALGQLPTEELLEGIYILIGGVLLLTPGFFTDILGMLCLFPYSRKYFVQQLISYYLRTHSSLKPSSRILDGEYRREED